MSVSLSLSLSHILMIYNPAASTKFLVKKFSVSDLMLNEDREGRR
jgi:hypothetical protein